MTRDEFIKQAREHQARFVASLGEGLDCYTTDDPRYKSDNPDKRVWLTMDAARRGLLFYDGIRQEVLNRPEIKARVEKEEVLDKRGKAVPDYLLSIALRSEHMPYNLFFPLIKRKGEPVVAEIFNRLAGFNEIAKVNDIVIEYAPAPRGEYTNDGTAFDLYVDYDNRAGERCGLGIEVKYSEKEYNVDTSSREWWNTHDAFGKPILSSPYKEVTSASGYYRDGVECLLVTDYLRQIWRNHILGASMIQHGDIKRFTSLILYPEGNSHFSDAAGIYSATLTEEARPTFGAVTYERYFAILSELLADEESKKWIDYLYGRYLF